MDDFLESKESFFECLPSIAIDKFEVDDTFITKYKAVKGLIDRHNGENVDLHTGTTPRWKLTPFHVSVFHELNDQVLLGPNYCAPKLTDYDKIALEHQMQTTSATCQWKTAKDRLRPDFHKALNRVVVPCQGTPWYCWVRTGRVISLGELFQELHLKYNAQQIYDLYLHLDIVSVKRKKPAGKSRNSRDRSNRNAS
jgi:hypothetical protein